MKADWDDRVCLTVDPSTFDLERIRDGHSVPATSEEINLAKGLCRSCPVLRACAMRALGLEARKRPISGVVWASVAMPHGSRSGPKHRRKAAVDELARVAFS